MSTLLLKNADELVTAIGTYRRGSDIGDIVTLKNASIYIKDGLINSIGSLNIIERYFDCIDEEIDLEGKVVIPGFIDAHTHLVFAGTREKEFAMRSAGLTYQEIAAKGGGILNTVEATRSASKSQLKESALQYVRRALRNGITTLEVKSGYGLDLENEMKILDVIEELNKEQPVSLIPTFMAAHAVPKGISREQYVKEVLDMIPKIKGKAIFSDVFCEEGYFNIEETESILIESKKHGLKLRLHSDQFTNNRSVNLAVGLRASSVDHLEQISDEEINLLSSSSVCAVLTPAVSFYMNYSYPPARKMIDRGCIVCMATDFNPGTSMCLSMQMLMSIACAQMRLTPEECITMTTLNPAYSLGLSDAIGSIEPGKKADLVVADVKSFKIIPYFMGENHVHTVIKSGKVVYSLAN